jgi:glycosyltransferase involved in cell wall biosynthesis
MNKKVIFISDFFISEVRGGAEFCNDALMNSLAHHFTFDRRKSETITPQFIQANRECFFIVANFFLLNEESKRALADKRYVIFEHDHKYIKSNNPSLYKDFLAPESQNQNKDFFKNARAVICQSKKHSQVVQKNLLLNNVVNSAGNIWTVEQLAVLEKNLDAEKTIEFAILNSHNKNKGMPAAIEFCQKNNLPFEYLNEAPFDKYIENISRIKHLVFFPQWLESYSRLAIEARILGCKLVTNSLLGAASEDYFKLKGKELLEFIKKNNTIIVDRWIKLIEDNEINHIAPIELPKITVFCPIYNAEKYIANFLQDMKNQTIFDDCELIIINANSPQNEDEHIAAFMKENKNVVYKKLDYRATVMETENIALKMSKGEFFAQSCVDDAHAPDYLETLAKHLYFTADVDLVYADCYQTPQPLETFENNSSNGQRYDHSLNTFSCENMIKCLPGPMPMWKKNIHERCGYFNEEMAHAGDWEMFLRMVETGSKFKKVDRPLGLYYYNTEGLSTGVEHAETRTKEEATVFFKYKDVFGTRNFQKYEDYFKQFLEV